MFSRSCDLDLDPTRASERASEAKRLGLAEFQDRPRKANRSDPLDGYRGTGQTLETKVPPKSRLRSTTMERYRMCWIGLIRIRRTGRFYFFCKDRAKIARIIPTTFRPTESRFESLFCLFFFFFSIDFPASFSPPLL